jgi:hypothetical protein
LAYKRRKEAVEQQIKEHNQAKQMAHKKPHPNSTNNVSNENQASNNSMESNKCPFIPTENNMDSVAKPTTNEISNETPLNQLKSNKKVVVSIQTNEEKAKENILSK